MKVINQKEAKKESNGNGVPRQMSKESEVSNRIRVNDFAAKEVRGGIKSKTEDGRCGG